MANLRRKDERDHVPALALIERVAGELGLEPKLRLVKVADREAAQRLRFLGSPTIRVGGRDVDPHTEERTDFGFSGRWGGVGLVRMDGEEQSVTGTVLEEIRDRQQDRSCEREVDLAVGLGDLELDQAVFAGVTFSDDPLWRQVQHG